jgi:hypothetical protein
MFTRVASAMSRPFRERASGDDAFDRGVPVGRVRAHGSTASSSSRAEPAANAAGPVRVSAGQAYPIPVALLPEQSHPVHVTLFLPMRSRLSTGALGNGWLHLESSASAPY